ncbi:aromatic amino acid hydroxylase [candidate division GN15 bacterium]|nr:aromatic amino acid hydroxylase [candidate division GN15 bacterium]
MTRGTRFSTGGFFRAPEVDRAGAGSATEEFTPIWEAVDNENLKVLPRHLKQFIVDQQYDKYTPVDHAVWRYVMRQNFAFLKDYAHESYTDGLKKTGIGIEKIPSIYEMNEILKRIDWACVTVDGFIPPAAFMEYQAYKVLVIAADMRQINHIDYTPAPDIIHEAAGHAPIIADPDYAEYLRRIGEVGAKAMSSKKDFELYEAIRHLSILKELPNPDPKEVEEAEKAVEYKQNNLGKPSEMALLSRLHWWTVEYGLVGELDNPKIYGAGLLSSIGESANCITPKVKKLPYNIKTADYAFDITTQQPQLFVTPDFNHLITVLEEFADQMAFRVGGVEGLNKAIECENVSTAVYSSGLQVSGVFTGVTVGKNNEPVYIKTTGPTALAVDHKQLKGHGRDYHAEGFGSPVGKLKGVDQPIEMMSDGDLKAQGIETGRRVSLEFESGITVEGQLERIERADGTVVLFVFTDCSAKNGDTVLFDPSWGTYDMAVGEKIVSVFCNAADKDAYEQPALVAKERTVRAEYDDKTKQLHEIYRQIRDYRESNKSDDSIVALYNDVKTNHPKDWLAAMEILEIVSSRNLFPETAADARAYLEQKAEKEGHLRKLITDGLMLVDNPFKKV